jgi:hypothetical protein
MTKKEFLALAQKNGKVLWRGLQKLTVGAGMVISAVITGVFGLIRDYFEGKRRFWISLEGLSSEQKIEALLIRRSITSTRMILCFILPAVTAFLIIFFQLSGIFDLESLRFPVKQIVEIVCGVFFFLVIPAFVFLFELPGLNDVIRTLDNNKGG